MQARRMAARVSTRDARTTAGSLDAAHAACSTRPNIGRESERRSAAGVTSSSLSPLSRGQIRRGAQHADEASRPARQGSHPWSSSLLFPPGLPPRRASRHFQFSRLSFPRFRARERCGRDAHGAASPVRGMRARCVELRHAMHMSALPHASAPRGRRQQPLCPNRKIGGLGAVAVRPPAAGRVGSTLTEAPIEARVSRARELGGL